MFERLTESARRVVVLSQDEARSLGHDWIGTEHLLLGVMRERDGVGAQVLDARGIAIEDVRASIVAVVGRDIREMHGQIPFTPRARRVLELSLREALSLGQRHIDTEHLLLAVVREEEGVAARTLEALGADAEVVRSEVVRRLSGGGRSGRSLATGTAFRWEYRVETVGGPDELTAEWLNEFGADGWQLVGFETGHRRVVFKRRADAATADTVA